MLDEAPFHADVAEAPEGGHVFWLAASDGVRLRAGHWRASGQADDAPGTILLLPGRTEYIEKYGRIVSDFTGRGWNVAVLDWRGQGLSDRLSADRNMGYVGRFSDYQHDLAALMAALEGRDAPGPYSFVAHSMGGLIALRALVEGCAVARAVFTAPMWGIMVPPALSGPVSWALNSAARPLGLTERYAPGTGQQNYLLTSRFRDNNLTSDPESYAYLIRQVAAHPELGIGGPSIHWFNEALTETRMLQRQPAPGHDVRVYLGSDETVVDISTLRETVARWDRAEMRMIAGARHEIMMESPAIRTLFISEADRFLREASSA
ncbi:MAG: alpha/beta hydrolase [Rhodobacteraceae bacterium]|nr:alpha/beta hydrolase [Paracoccaceae bacterium]